MHPIHDIDALLLLAVGLASKRRAAELSEVVAAAELIHGSVPAAPKLAEAFARLSAHGLLCEMEGRFALTAPAQAIVTGLPKKVETEERLFALKQKLYAYQAAADQPPIAMSEAQVDEAIDAHRALAKASGKNMFMPKPKPAEGDNRRPARPRKPFFRARRG